MVKNHNRGPNGPLDPSEPPPFDPGLRRDEEIDADYAVAALRSMDVKISKRDLEHWHAIDEGPAYRPVAVRKLYRWGDILDWAARTPAVPLLTREEATEYIRSQGYPIGATVLSQLRANGPRYVYRGKHVYYDPEDLRAWIEQRGRPHHSTAPKYKPAYAKKHCLSYYEHCPNVKHERCAKYARALCHFAPPA